MSPSVPFHLRRPLRPVLQGYQLGANIGQLCRYFLEVCEGGGAVKSVYKHMLRPHGRTVPLVLNPGRAAC